MKLILSWRVCAAFFTAQPSFESPKNKKDWTVEVCLYCHICIFLLPVSSIGALCLLLYFFLFLFFCSSGNRWCTVTFCNVHLVALPKRCHNVWTVKWAQRCGDGSLGFLIRTLLPWTVGHSAVVTVLWPSFYLVLSFVVSNLACRLGLVLLISTVHPLELCRVSEWVNKCANLEQLYLWENIGVCVSIECVPCASIREGEGKKWNHIVLLDSFVLALLLYVCA